jgi:hypothetical protein
MLPFLCLLLLCTSTSALVLLNTPNLHKISKTFPFPSTPYKDGLRHIHSIEHILNIDDGVYFQIHSTTQPVTYGKYTIVSATCSVQNIRQEIRMFSKQQDVSYVVCIRNGIPQVTLELKVIPQIQGHLLTINASTYLRAPLWTNLMLTPLWHFVSVFESTSTTLDANTSQNNENLIKYRELVFRNQKSFF